MTTAQVPMWEKPPGDATPIEKGGAVLIVRLTPDEAAQLLRLAPTLHEGVHVALAALLSSDGGPR